MADIISSIETISGSYITVTTSSALLIGTSSGSSSCSIAVSGYVSNFTDLTEDNFIVEIVELPSASSSGSYTQGMNLYGFTPVKSYDYRSGLLTITGLNCFFKTGSSSTNPNGSGITSYANINVYLVDSIVDMITND